MNKFDLLFFQKYLPTGTKIKYVIHAHIISILGTICINYFFWVLIPTFLYYTSDVLKQFIPFYVLEIFILLMFVKIIYDILDWYNDVWIVTEEWVIELDWALFSLTNVSVKYDSIEGIEIVQDGILDSILGKWKLIIHKIGWGDNFILENASLPYEAIDEIEQISKQHQHDEDDEDEDEPHFHKWQYNMLIEALSWVVEQYMENSWYKKDDSQEKEEIIAKVKRKKGTIDMR